MSCINYNKLRIRTFGRQKNKKQNKKYCRYDYTEIGKKKKRGAAAAEMIMINVAS